MKLALRRAITACKDMRWEGDQMDSQSAIDAAEEEDEREFTADPSGRYSRVVIGCDHGKDWFNHLIGVADSGSALAQCEAGGWYARGLAPIQGARYWDRELKGRAKIYIEKDYQKAAHYLRCAAKQGIPQAAHELGDLYIRGHIQTNDDSEPIPWLFQYAAIGGHEACLALGRRYLAGVGVATDAAEAARWFERGAQAGNGNARFELALLYLLEIGVPKDEGLALRQLARARAQCPEQADEFMARFGSHFEEE